MHLRITSREPAFGVAQSIGQSGSEMVAVGTVLKREVFCHVPGATPWWMMGLHGINQTSYALHGMFIASRNIGLMTWELIACFAVAQKWQQLALS